MITNMGAAWCLAVLLLLGGCGGSEHAEDDGATSVKLQLNWVPEPQFGGIYQARLDGVFKDEGLNVEILQGSAGVSAPQLADNGTVDFAIVAGSQVLQLNAKGGSLVALFAVFQSDPHGFMVPVDSTYEGLGQLWADPDAIIGAEAELAFVKAITMKYGVKDGARLVAYNLPAFRAGRQQASQCFVMAEPVSLELEGFETRVFLANESGFNEYNTVLVTRRSFLESNRETCVAMARAFSRGWTAYLADPARANKHMAGLNPAMSEEAMALSARKQAPLIQDALTRKHGLGYMTSERWDHLGSQLVEMDLLDKAPPAHTVYTWLLAEAPDPSVARGD